MLASCEAWGGTLSALRPHQSITLIARCIAKYRSPDTYPSFGAGVYTVHTHSSLPSALLSSNRTPRCSKMHPASAPRAIPQLGAEPSPASVGFPTQQKISAQAVFGACHPRDHIYTKAAQAATRSGRDKMNPTPSVGGGAGQWPEHYREDVAPACAFLNAFLSAFLGTFWVTQPLFPTFFQETPRWP